MVLGCLGLDGWTAAAAIAAGVTALATLGVALVTLSSARAARRAADAAERSILLQSVPVIFGWEAKRTGGGRTEVKLRAVGHGSGFNISAEVRQDGVSLGATPTVSHLEGGSEEPARDTVPPCGLVDERRGHEVVTTYRDAAGNSYRTVRRSLPGGVGELTAFQRRRPDSDSWEPMLS